MTIDPQRALVEGSARSRRRLVGRPRRLPVLGERPERHPRMAATPLGRTPACACGSSDTVLTLVRGEPTASLLSARYPSVLEPPLLLPLTLLAHTGDINTSRRSLSIHPDHDRAPEEYPACTRGVASHRPLPPTRPAEHRQPKLPPARRAEQRQPKPLNGFSLHRKSGMRNEK